MIVRFTAIWAWFRKLSYLGRLDAFCIQGRDLAIEQETPVEAVDVELQVLSTGEALHEDAEEAVVRPLLECQSLAVVHVQYEFLRAAMA